MDSPLIKEPRHLIIGDKRDISQDNKSAGTSVLLKNVSETSPIKPSSWEKWRGRKTGILKCKTIDCPE